MCCRNPNWRFYDLRVFSFQAALGALLLSPDEVDQMVASSDDGFVKDDSNKSWEIHTMNFNCVPCHSNISEPGGNVPVDANCVGTLLSPKLSLAARQDHEKKLFKKSHRSGHIDRAEDNRRFAIAFETALAPLITTEDYNFFKELDGQVNMDIDSMIFQTWDGKKMVKEYSYGPDSELGYASHNVSTKLKLEVRTCRGRSGLYPWKQMMQTVSQVLDN